MPRKRHLNDRCKTSTKRPLRREKTRIQRPSYKRWCPTPPIWIVLLFGGCLVYVLRNAKVSNPFSQPRMQNVIQSPPSRMKTRPFMQDLQNCTISYVPPPQRRQTEWRKPLWIPSFPSSGSCSPRYDVDTQLSKKDHTNNFFCDSATKEI